MSAFQDETVYKTDRPLQQAKPSLLRLDYFPSQLLLLSRKLSKYKGWNAIFFYFTERFRPIYINTDTMIHSHFLMKLTGYFKNIYDHMWLTMYICLQSFKEAVSAISSSYLT